MDYRIEGYSSEKGAATIAEACPEECIEEVMKAALAAGYSNLRVMRLSDGLPTVPTLPHSQTLYTVSGIEGGFGISIRASGAALKDALVSVLEQGWHSVSVK